MKKHLIITPHLSTGGAPQVTANKIKLLKEEQEILLVEYSRITWHFNIQRNRIINYIGEERLVTLDDNKLKLLEIIQDFNPDYISVEELCETFMDESLIKEIYGSNRKYKIFETTHDSSFPTTLKRHYPDKFIFVSAYNALRYVNKNIPFDVIEYPIDERERNKKESQIKLSLDPEYKHILNVGLFTPRKNQKYIFEIAEVLKNYKIKFHFIGNQAGNFEFYWKPLMENKPDNCIVWGERDDVYDFIDASDIFFFASKGDKNNKELNPIALKEAVEFKIPMLMYNLDVYNNKYDKYDFVNYLTGDINDDIKTILKILEMDNTEQMFHARYEKNENKISIDYYGNEPVDYKVSVKDLTSTAPMYWFNFKANHSVGYYCIPIPKHIKEFDRNSNFRGFLIEFYDQNENFKFKKELIVNDIFPNHPKINFEPFDCNYINYYEFFIDRCFDGYNYNYLDTVIDIGANVGLFSKHCFMRKASNAILVEANPNLRKNIETVLGDDIDKSILMMSAVTSKKEKVKFKYSSENTTIGTLVFDSNVIGYENLDSEMELETITIDDIFNEVKTERISLFKCDIEGGEYDLFESLKDEHISKIDNFMIEFHGNDNGQILPILDKLDKFGFKYELVKFEMGESKLVDKDCKHGVIITI